MKRGINLARDPLPASSIGFEIQASLCDIRGAERRVGIRNRLRDESPGAFNPRFWQCGECNCECGISKAESKNQKTWNQSDFPQKKSENEKINEMELDLRADSKK